MIKQLLGILLLFLVLTGAFSQTTVWEEDFHTAEGWNLESNWTVTGDKLQFYWSPEASNFDLTATSPPFYIDEHVTEIQIEQYLNVFYQSPDELAQIMLLTPDGDVALWDYPLTNGNWGSVSGSELILPVQDYAGMEVQLQFRTTGITTFNWNEWDIFGVRVLAVYDHDLSASGITGPVAIDLFETGIWTVDVTNLGQDDIADYTVSIYDNKTNALIGSIDEQDMIEPGETRFYDFQWQSNAAFNTSFKAVVEYGDDQFKTNNKSKSAFVRVRPDFNISILVWDHDNGIPTIEDPEKGDLIEPSNGLKRILDDAGIDYEFTGSLPDNLENYDIVFSTMGCFCLD